MIVCTEVEPCSYCEKQCSTKELIDCNGWSDWEPLCTICNDKRAVDPLFSNAIHAKLAAENDADPPLRKFLRNEATRIRSEDELVGLFRSMSAAGRAELVDAAKSIATRAKQS